MGGIQEEDTVKCKWCGSEEDVWSVTGSCKVCFQKVVDEVREGGKQRRRQEQSPVIQISVEMARDMSRIIRWASSPFPELGYEARPDIRKMADELDHLIKAASPGGEAEG